MTTELTKAAQQALEACPFCGCDMRIESNRDWHKLRGNHAEGCVFSEDAPVMTVPATDCQLEVLVHDWNNRALTQRTAAQTEREAFEAWFDDYHDKACAEFGGIDCTDPKGIAEDAWQARASLPAPKQATPEPCDGAQIRAIGEGLRSAHDHIEMHRLERSHCKDAERIREGLAAFSAYKKRGDFAATPESVGEPAAWEYQNQHGNKFLTHSNPNKWHPHDQEGFKSFRPLVYGDTRPAPGVPELLPALEGLLEAAEWLCGGRDEATLTDDVCRAMDKARAALAAAQAKGGEHG